MVIDNFRDEDMPDYISFLEKCYSDMSIQNHEFDPGSVRKFLKSPSLSIRAAKEKGKLVGMMGFYFMFHPMNNKKLNVAEIFWHADPGLSKFKQSKIMVILYNKFIGELEQINIDSFHINLPFDSQIKRFLEKKGFLPSEIHYVKKNK